MPRSFTDEAIVLRAHNVGETDRFVLLLTRQHGRIMARVMGARKLLSQRGRGLLPLHLLSVVWEHHSFGNLITSTQCIDTHQAAWRTPHTFACIGQGIELLLKITEDGHPLPEAYQLTHDFLAAANAEHASTCSLLYILKLLNIMGYLPSGATVSGHASLGARAVLDTVMDLPFASAPRLAHLEAELGVVVSSLLGSQLGVTLKSLPVSLAISSAVTPTCHVNGRAS